MIHIGLPTKKTYLKRHRVLTNRTQVHFIPVHARSKLFLVGLQEIIVFTVRFHRCGATSRYFDHDDIVSKM